MVSTDLSDSAFEAALAEWAPIPSPADNAEAWQLGDQLTQAVDGLPPELRSVVLLVDVEGASMQGVPEGTVASRLFRARRQLRTALEAPAREARLWRRQ
jgi:DNA-directed RNA polymerase specialized sigma24 family protein